MINSINIQNEVKAYKKQNKTICFILKSFNDCKIYPILEEVRKKLSIQIMSKQERNIMSKHKYNIFYIFYYTFISIIGKILINKNYGLSNIPITLQHRLIEQDQITESMLTRMQGINIKHLITDKMSNRQIIKDIINNFISSLICKAFNFD